MKLGMLEKAQFNSKVKRINSRIAALKEQGLTGSQIEQIKHDTGIDRLPLTAGGNVSQNTKNFDKKTMELLDRLDSQKEGTISKEKEKIEEKIPDVDYDNLSEAVDKVKAINQAIKWFFDKYYELIKKYEPDLFSKVSTAPTLSDAMDMIDDFSKKHNLNYSIKSLIDDFF